MMVSLDGYIESTRPNEDWVTVDEELHRFINDTQRDVDTAVYGRKLYEAMSYWYTADEHSGLPDYELEFAELWRGLQVYVFSTTLQKVGANARLLRGNAVEEVAKLKDQPGKNIEVGGAELAAGLIRAGLVDEYWLYCHPVLLGGGVPMFPLLEKRQDLTVVDRRLFSSGVTLLRCVPKA
jgi:dihydrofolate reductase